MSDGSDKRQVSWLYRQENRKTLWWAFGLVLAATFVVVVAPDADVLLPGVMVIRREDRRGRANRVHQAGGEEGLGLGA